MSEVFRRRIVGALAIAALLSAALFWSTQIALSAARGSLRDARSNTIPPLLLRGLVIDLKLAGPSADKALADPRFRRKVLFVLSDDCRFCVAAVEPFCAFLKSQHWADDVGWAFVSLRGSSIPAALMSCARTTVPPGGSVAEEVPDSILFTHSTGILGTPFVAVLDRRNRLMSTFEANEVNRLPELLR